MQAKPTKSTDSGTRGVEEDPTLMMSALLRRGRVLSSHELVRVGWLQNSQQLISHLGLLASPEGKPVFKLGGREGMEKVERATRHNV
jgi:hypothetical protein